MSYGHGIKLVRPLSTVDNTRDYARVSHNSLTIRYFPSTVKLRGNVQMCLMDFGHISLQFDYSFLNVLEQDVLTRC